MEGFAEVEGVADPAGQGAADLFKSARLRRTHARPRNRATEITEAALLAYGATIVEAVGPNGNSRLSTPNRYTASHRAIPSAHSAPSCQHLHEDREYPPDLDHGNLAAKHRRYAAEARESCVNRTASADTVA